MTNSQKTIKIFGIVLAIVIIVAMINGILFILGGFDLFMTRTNYIKTEVHKLQDVNNIEINIAASKLEIIESDEFKIEIPDYITYKYQVMSDKIIIKEKNTLYRKNSKIVIYIPKDKFFNEFIIKGGAGTISVDSILANEVKLELGAGRVVINKIIAKELFRLDGGAGSFELNDGNLTNASIDIGIGNIEMKTILNGNSDIDMGVGNLNIDLVDNIDNYSFNIDKGIGNVIVDGNHVNGKYGKGINYIKIDGGIGNINIY